MLKDINIKNFQGIKESKLDFRVKYKRDGNGMEDQVIKKDGDFIMINPTLFGRNATGKSVTLNAILEISNFWNEKAFTNYIFKILRSIRTNIVTKNILSQLNERSEVEISDEDSRIILEKNIQNYFAKDFLRKSRDKTSEYIIESNYCGTNIEITGKSTDVIFCIGNNEVSINEILGLLSLYLLDTTSKEFEKISDDDIFYNSRVFIQKYLNLKGLKFPKNNASIEFLTSDDYLKNLNNVSLMNSVKSIVNMGTYNFLKEIIKVIDPNISIEQNESEAGYKLIDQNNIQITWNEVSAGTKKTIILLDKALKSIFSGGILLIDEIENGLHPLLIKLITMLFSDEDLNKKESQIILTTHSPVIFELDIINKYNAFLSNGDGFDPIVKMNSNPAEGNSRKTDATSFLKTKNIYSDSFWIKRNYKPFNPTNNQGLNMVVGRCAEDFKYAN